MDKVHILTTCTHCNGAAYLPLAEQLNANGKPYMRHIPCPMCAGSGLASQWVSLQEFAILLVQAVCPHKHTSFHGRMHFSSGEPWDDIHEVCDDCGARLDASTPIDLVHKNETADIP